MLESHDGQESGHSCRFKSYRGKRKAVKYLTFHFNIYVEIKSWDAVSNNYSFMHCGLGIKAFCTLNANVHLYLKRGKFKYLLIKMYCSWYNNLCIFLEELSTVDIKTVMEKILSGWKDVVQHLEEVARKIKYQEDINAYFKEMSELEKTLIEKDGWLKNDASSASQPSALLKQLCQVSLEKLHNFDCKLLWAQNSPEELSLVSNITQNLWGIPIWLEDFWYLCHRSTLLMLPWY